MGPPYVSLTVLEFTRETSWTHTSISPSAFVFWALGWQQCLSVWCIPCFLPVLWDAGCWRPFSPAQERSIKHNDLAHSSRVSWGCSWEGLWSLSDVERQKLSVEKLICQQYVLEYECISVYSPLQQYNKRQYVLQILFVKQCWDSYPINIFIVNIELLSLLGLLKVPIVLWMKL